jgi:hypothetical protein
MKDATKFEPTKSWRDWYMWSDLQQELKIEYVEGIDDFEGQSKFDLNQYPTKWLHNIEGLCQELESTYYELKLRDPMC